MFKAKTRLLIALVSAGMVVSAASANAAVAVIVNKANAGINLSKGDVSKIFLRKTKKLPNGSKIVAIEQNEGQATREEFHKKVTNKSPSQLKSYWSRQIFTGKGSPPQASGNDDAVLSLIAKNPNMIGYVNASKAKGNANVHVVHMAN